jgi:hydroxymethylbilane synthase
VAERLGALSGRPVELVEIRTTGDAVLDRPLAEMGGKGLFTRELDDALLEGRVDLAVHSLKDLPAVFPEGIVLGAVPEREDPRDVLIAGRSGDATLESLPARARVGTGSLRRTALLRATRSDLEVVPLRGNVDTRIRKVDAGEVAAVILAAAGVKRLGWVERVSQFLDPASWIPAPGQGALALVAREGDREVLDSLARLEHAPSRAQAEAERGLLRGLEAGCQLPVAAFAIPFGSGLRLRAIVAAPDGSQIVRGEMSGSAAAAGAIGERLAALLLERGADLLLDRLRAPSSGDDS